MSWWWLFLGLCVVYSLNALPGYQKQSLESLRAVTGGDDWIDKWNTMDDPCGWKGVSCNSDNSTVLSLILPSNNLTGTLPNLLLPDLTHL